MPMIEPASVIWLAPGARDAEVRHLHAPLGVDEHVVRLDVAVHDPVAMREAQRGEDLPRVVDRDRHRRGPRATISSFSERPSRYSIAM